MIEGPVLDTARKPAVLQAEETLTGEYGQKKQALVAAWLGQAFDAMNTMMFFIIMYPALSELLHSSDATKIGWHGGLIVAVFTVGWGLGSILFGLIADHVGRVKTMAGSILLYALASGLCAISTHWWDLAAYRFFVGLGIGGECSLGAVLVSECWPKHRKLWALSVMNTSWPVGAMLTGIFNLFTGVLGWRFLFLVGVLPALATFYIRATMREPQAFQAMKAKRTHVKNNRDGLLSLEQQSLIEHPLKAIFNPQYVLLTVLSVTIITSATVGYYASIAWMPAWINQITGSLAVQERSNATLYQSLGSLIACIFPSLLVMRWGYKGALIAGFLGSFLIPFGMFTFVHSYVPEMVNVCSLGIGLVCTVPWVIMFSYLPEIYPTQLLGTGAGFAWAVGRFLTAVAGLCAGPIIAFFHGSYGAAAAAFTLPYLIGLLAAFFIHEPGRLRIRTN